MKEALISFFDRKKVLILGFGREGRATLEFLMRYVPTADVTVADRERCFLKVPSPLSCGGFTEEDLPCKHVWGDGYLDGLDAYDVIMKSPGISLLNRVSDTVRARITSQTDLFLRFHKNTVVGITGTKGKSTTSSLISHILSECGKKTVLVGNIGIPVFTCLDKMTADTVAVYELSCHQLEYVAASPDVAVLLNVYPDHLDHYGTFEAYAFAKQNIYRFMKPTGTLIVNKDGGAIDHGEIARSVPHVIEIDPAAVTVRESNLLGDHNAYNIEVAVTACRLCGCGDEEMDRAVKTFKGLEHRMEFVTEKNGVKYYNDSISTIPEATEMAVRSIKDVTTLLVGGMDRGIDYDGLADFLADGAVKNVIFMYESGKRVSLLTEKRLKKDVNLYYVDDLEAAVKLAKRITDAGSVLLSPAAASYGYFKNFEDRGQQFKRMIRSDEF